jgi:hypothetical protein
MISYVSIGIALASASAIYTGITSSAKKFAIVVLLPIPPVRPIIFAILYFKKIILEMPPVAFLKIIILRTIL